MELPHLVCANVKPVDGGVGESAVMLWTHLLQLASNVDGVSEKRLPSHALVLHDTVDELHLGITEISAIFAENNAFLAGGNVSKLW